MLTAFRAAALSVLLVGVCVQPASAGEGWQRIGDGMTAGASGIAMLGDGDAFVVRDNKKAGENRAVRVRLDEGEVAGVDPIAWPGELPVDLEAVTRVPDRGDEYVALAGGGRAFHVRLRGTRLTVLRAFPLPEGDPADNYESLALKKLGGRLVAVWADRGQDRRPATLYTSTVDLTAGRFGPVSTAVLRVPYPAHDVRHASDVEITADARILVTSASDPGDAGPFDSAVYEAGRLGPDGRIRLAVRELARYPGHKIEALTCVTRTCAKVLYGTDDEEAGGALRLDDLGR